MLQDLILEKSAILQASPAEVWDALVNPEKIKIYLFGTNTSSTWQKGDPIVFTGEWEGGSYRDGGTILEIERERILKYNYRSSFSSLPDLPENYATITFRLKPLGSGTELSLEQRGFESAAAVEHSEGNWNSVLEKIRGIVES